MADRKPIVNSSGTIGELVSTDSLLVPSITFPDLDVVTVKTFAGKSTLDLAAISGFGAGLVQSSMARKKIYSVMPAGAYNTNLSVFGAGPVTVQGNNTTRTPANTNMFTRTRRHGTVSNATAGSICGYRFGDPLLWLGNGSGLGGFFKCMRFGCSDAATVSGARQFVGTATTGSAATDVEPSTLLNCIGVGNGASDTNLQLFYGGSTAQTPIDLGSNFPANTLSADLYELTLYSPPELLTTIYVRVERLNTGHVFETTISTASSAVLPAVTFKLNLIWAYRSNNATALAVGLDLISDYVESDY